MNTTTNTNQSAAARDIPVPPGGGSWSFDDSKREWVSNDTAPEADATAAGEQDINTTIEQEQ